MSTADGHGGDLIHRATGPVSAYRDSRASAPASVRPRIQTRTASARILCCWVVLALSCLAGCGKSDPLSVAATATRFQLREDCGLLTTAARVSITGRAEVGPCHSVLVSRGRLPSGTVSHVIVRGDRAKASLLNADQSPILTFYLFRVGGTWQIAAIRAVTPPSLEPLSLFIAELTPLLRAAAPLGYEQAQVLAPAQPAGSLARRQVVRLRAIARQARQIALAVGRLAPPPDLRGPLMNLAIALDDMTGSENHLVEATSRPVTSARILAYRSVRRADGLALTADTRLEQILLPVLKHLTSASDAEAGTAGYPPK